MAKITRYDGNLLAFGASAQGTERTVFGDTAQSDALDDNLNSDFLRGWGIVAPSENPTRQDFNALGFTLGQLIAYLHQQGVPEWNAEQEYFIGSVAQKGGRIYIAQTGTDGSPNVGIDPATDDGANWLEQPNVSSLRAETLSDLRALSAGSTTSIYILGRSAAGDGGEGHFHWDSSDLSTEVGNDEVTNGEGDGGIYIAPDSDKTGASGAWVRQFTGMLDARWYGVKGEGASSNSVDTAALQVLLNAAPDGEGAYIPKGDYEITDALFVRSNTTIKAHPEARFYSENATADDILIGTKDGGIADSTDLVADAALRDTTISVADASIFSAGDHVLLGQDVNYADTVPMQGEVHLVRSVDTGSDEITLEEGLWEIDGYKTTNSAQAHRLTMMKSIHVEGGIWEGVTSGTQFYGMAFEFIEGFSFSRARIRNFDRIGLKATTILHGQIKYNICEDVDDDEGYGIMLSEACQWVDVSENYAYRCGKLFDISGRGANYGWARFIDVHHNHAYACTRGSISTHECAGEISIHDNVLWDQQNTTDRGAIFLRSTEVSVHNNVVKGVIGENFGIRVRNQGRRGYARVTGNIVESDGNAPISVTLAHSPNGTFTRSLDDVRVSNNQIKGRNSVGITVFASIDAVDGELEKLMVEANTVDSLDQCIKIETGDSHTIGRTLVGGNVCEYGGGGDVGEDGAILFRSLGSSLIDTVMVTSNITNGGEYGVRESGNDVGDGFVTGNHLTATTPVSGTFGKGTNMENGSVV